MTLCTDAGGNFHRGGTENAEKFLNLLVLGISAGNKLFIISLTNTTFVIFVAFETFVIKTVG